MAPAATSALTGSFRLSRSAYANGRSFLLLLNNLILPITFVVFFYVIVVDYIFLFCINNEYLVIALNNGISAHHCKIQYTDQRWWLSESSIRLSCGRPGFGFGGYQRFF